MGMLDKIKGKVVQATIFVSGLFTTATTMTSCDEHFEKQNRLEACSVTKDRNPTADSISSERYSKWRDCDFDYDDISIGREYAERFTDSTKIKSIKEKYKQQLAEYMKAYNKYETLQYAVDNMLLNSAIKGDIENVKKALDNGADVNVQDKKNGDTALMCVIKHCNDTQKAFDVAKYLLGEPSIRTKIKNKEGLIFADYLRVKIDNKTDEPEWYALSRMLNEPTITYNRARGNTQIDRYANWVRLKYKNLMETYGKEMQNALGYVYKATNSKFRRETDFWGKVSYYGVEKTGAEIITNEDGSKKIVKVVPSAVHPVGRADLILPQPKQKYLSPEEIDLKVEKTTKREGIRPGRKHTVNYTDSISTTRDGQKHVTTTKTFGRGK